jgi:hypothetical protein
MNKIFYSLLEGMNGKKALLVMNCAIHLCENLLIETTGLQKQADDSNRIGSVLYQSRAEMGFNKLYSV